MNGDPGGRRRRAVRLTEEGQIALTNALASRSHNGNGLTREKKAELLDFSVVTVDRIVKGLGVDRSTLKTAFRRLDIEWKDSYCEFVAPDAPYDDVPEEATPPIGRASAPRWLAFVPVIVVCACLIGWASFVVIPYVRSVLRGQHADQLANLADTEFGSGYYEAARKHAKEAAQIAFRDKNAPQLARLDALLGQLCAELGDFTSSLQYYQEALSLQNGLREQRSLPPLLESIGLAEGNLGRLDAAEKHLKASLNGYVALRDQPGVAMLTRDLGSLAATKGKVPQAEKLLKTAESLARELNKEDMVIDILARQALIMRDTGQVQQARVQLNQCLAFWKSHNHPRWVARTMYQIGTVEAVAGNAGEAAKWFNESKRLFQSLGDGKGIQDCERWQSASPAALKHDLYI